MTAGTEMEECCQICQSTRQHKLRDTSFTGYARLKTDQLGINITYTQLVDE